MIEFGSNKVRSIREYCLSSLVPLYGKEESLAIIYELFEHFLGYRKHEIESHADDPLNESVIVDFVHALKRLRKYEPLQYVLSRAWFRGLQFYVDKSVLIPRPETEELVEEIITDYKSRTDLNILDICTGSGCIAIALAKELKNAKVTATDISEDALQVAQKNIIKHRAQVTLVKDDILHSTLNMSPGSFDIIVSNPPYVMKKEAASMLRNVLDHEPSLALFVPDDDPLVFYRKISEHATQWLKTGGSIYFEINEQMGQDVASLLRDLSFSDVSVHSDLSGKSRIVKGILRR